MVPHVRRLRASEARPALIVVQARDGSGKMKRDPMAT